MVGKGKLGTALVLALLLNLAIVFAGFVAPYSPEAQNRDFPYAPPTRIHFIDAEGHLHIRPFVYSIEAEPNAFNQYRESHDQVYPLRLFVRGPHYEALGLLSSTIHLFAVDAPAQIFFAGTDQYGRDQFSRILYGGQISLAAGVIATTLSLLLGLIVGCFSGLYGGWIDESVMGLAELFLVLPWLYFLLAVRAFLPLHLRPTETFLLLVAVVGLLGWARPARLIRGVVLGAKSRAYVLASRGFGASDFYIVRRHVAPHLYGVVLTQFALLVPQYILAEVTLSFLGLGLSEPKPSWGGLLSSLQLYNVMVSYWWMFLPAVALTLVSLGYLAVANALQERLQSASM